MSEPKTGSKQRGKQRKPKADGSSVPKQEANPNLNAGGTPGNRGGGNIKNRIHDISTHGHAKVLTTILGKVDKKGPEGLTNKELILLLDKLGKYGVGSKVEIHLSANEQAAIVIAKALKYIPEELWPTFQAEIKEELDQYEPS